MYGCYLCVHKLTGMLGTLLIADATVSTKQRMVASRSDTEGKNSILLPSKHN